MNEITDAESSLADFQQPMPAWWPRHADGEMVTHLYWLLDEEWRSDLEYPGLLDPAIRNYVQANKPVNFFDPDIKEPSIP